MPKHRRSRPLALEPIEPRRLLAFAAELVADVNATPIAPETDPRDITHFNGVAIYSAFTPSHGRELWRSDGTPEGTFQLLDIAPGTASSDPTGFANVDGTLYFAAAAPGQGAELWRTDGTAAGTVLVDDIRAGETGSSPRRLVNVNGTLFFVADDGVHGAELWKSDGSSAGTRLVRDIRAGSGSANPRELTAANGRLFFITGGAQSNTLWKSDGTAAGTSAILGGLVSDLTEVGGKLFYSSKSSAWGTELGISDGTSAGTRTVKNINPGINSSFPSELTNIGNTLFFRANDGVHGEELWKSDGTADGTLQVADLRAGSTGSSPRNLFNANGTLFFVAGNGNTLWKSNGSSAGTSEVSNDVWVDATVPFANVGDSLYFRGRSSFIADGLGMELWRSDGSREGTLAVADLYPGTYPGFYDGYDFNLPNGSFPQQLTAITGRVVFQATNASGSHLWSSDGTRAGTQLIDNVSPPTATSLISQLWNFNGQLLFAAMDGSTAGTWTSDGSSAGTSRLASHGTSVDDFARDFAYVNGTAYFAANGRLDGISTGIELWKTDGTQAGTVLVADIEPARHYEDSPGGYYLAFGIGSNPRGFVSAGAKVIFAATTKSQGRELWATDGSTGGTTLLKDIRVGQDSAGVDQLIALGKRVFFTANDGVHGQELWSTDGTAAGTQMVKDINPFPNSLTGPQDLFVVGDSLYFTASDGVHGRELWQSDGTRDGTVMTRDLVAGDVSSHVANLTEVNDTLYFTTSGDGGDKLLWKSRGSVTFVANIGTASGLTNGSGTLFFSSDVGGAGAELWKTNGTRIGTVRVKDLIPGPGGSQPRELQGVNGVLFFEADLPGGGRGFWMSNGTREGTVPVLDDPGPLTGMRFLTNANGQLFFAGTDVEHGEELWKLTTGNPVVQFSGSMTYQENSGLKLIAPFAQVSNTDNAAFAGGQLTVVISKNAGPADLIAVRHEGNGPGQIGVDGSIIRYGGVLIGISSHVQGSGLLINLNANASAAITQSLLRNIGYRNLSDNPSTKQRIVTVTLSDGSGGISQPVSKTIDIQAFNDAPRLVLGGQVSYQNNSAGVLLAPSATVTDPDSANFFGALLTVEITSARGPSNRLQLGGGYSIDGDRLLRNGVQVGTVLESGFGWNDLRLRFNSQMNAARAQELIRSLRFRTVGNTNLDPRTISFSLTDGDGGVSATQTKTVNLTN